MLPRRATLRLRVMVGVVAVTLIALAAFDFGAVTIMRGYLLKTTSTNLQRVLTVTEPRVQSLVYGKGSYQLLPVMGEYSLAYQPDHGPQVTLEEGAVALSSLPRNGKADRQSFEYSAISRYEILAAQPVTGGVLVAGASLDQVNKTVNQVILIVTLGSVAAVLLIGLGVFLVLRRGMRPIEAMATQADRITAGDLTDRVDVRHPTSEVGRLGTALNGMLDRIESSLAERQADQERMRQFFADASHELRTPLASLRANAEFYQQGGLTESAQVDEMIRRMALETQRMSHLVNDMLRLARLGQHPGQQDEPVDVTALVEGCVERARIAAPGRLWSVNVPENLIVLGDEESLVRALDNLLSNVRTHTPADTTATITVASHSGGGPGNDTGGGKVSTAVSGTVSGHSRGGTVSATVGGTVSGTVTIEVADDGPGVPAAELPHIFDRFYRGSAPVRRPGSGLGLAIVSAIAAAHGGSVRASAGHPRGLRVTLTLPEAQVIRLNDQMLAAAVP